jgi:hypothetical protein
LIFAKCNVLFQDLKQAVTVLPAAAAAIPQEPVEEWPQFPRWTSGCFKKRSRSLGIHHGGSPFFEMQAKARLGNSRRIHMAILPAALEERLRGSSEKEVRMG